MAELKKKKSLATASHDTQQLASPRCDRIIIEHVWPEIDSGTIPIKRVPGEEVLVRADIYSDGHNEISAELLYRPLGEKGWRVSAMAFLGNDLWEARFCIEEFRDYEYTIRGWVNRFTTWQHEFQKRFKAGQDLTMHIQIGQGLLKDLLTQPDGDFDAADPAVKRARKLAEGKATPQDLLDRQLSELSGRIPEEKTCRDYPRHLRVQVDRERALSSAWYEFFPRSFGVGGRHGTLRDCIPVLKEVARMGFNVVYLPPIHPIGQTKRKGRNNAVSCVQGDPGSPWAIGSKEGGHKAVHPELGTLEDFRHFVKEAGKLGLDIALDVAFQCSPDHPYVKEHPEWFVHRPDGSIQYAENPPKKYEDVYPINFETTDREGLWNELKSIFEFWIRQGVTIFRVDNPHTKPFVFWSWVIGELRLQHPEVIFLSEAFTRPKVMTQLAKNGFTQSYTYFTWRSTKAELTEYIGQLQSGEAREVFRPNFWPNTPDILAQHLQNAPRQVFISRFVLAATLSSNYGMYGPAYELCENQPVEGKEEYIYSEKYELKKWDWDRPGNIKDVIARVNQLRKSRPEFQTTWNTRFCEIENQQIIAYVKADQRSGSYSLVAVNLDPARDQNGWVKVPLYDLGFPTDLQYEAKDLVSGKSMPWKGEWNQVSLDTRERCYLILELKLDK